MIATISRLAPAILRHLDAYVEIAAEDARELVAAKVGRLLAVLIAAAAASFSVLMLCIWMLAVTWDGPYRAWVPAGLALIFALCAAVLAYRARRPAEKPFERLRREWRKDRELIEQAIANFKGSVKS